MSKPLGLSPRTRLLILLGSATLNMSIGAYLLYLGIDRGRGSLITVGTGLLVMAAVGLLAPKWTPWLEARLAPIGPRGKRRVWWTVVAVQAGGAVYVAVTGERVLGVAIFLLAIVYALGAPSGKDEPGSDFRAIAAQEAMDERRRAIALRAKAATYLLTIIGLGVGAFLNLITGGAVLWPWLLLAVALIMLTELGATAYYARKM